MPSASHALRSECLRQSPRSSSSKSKAPGPPRWISAFNPLVTDVFKLTAAFLLGLLIDFQYFAHCPLPKDGTLKVDKLDGLPLLHIHRDQSKVRTTPAPLP